MKLQSVKFLLPFALCGLCADALAQVPVQTVPLGSTTTGGNASTTIGTGGTTFQLVFASANNSIAPTTAQPGARHGCSIQNNGTHTMWVAEGQSAATATQGKSWQLAAGALF